MTTNFLTIALVQTDIVWENKVANLAHYDELLSKITDKADVIVLPETFATGFSMQVETLAEPTEGGYICDWMHQKARQFDAAVTGSIITRTETGHYVNRLTWVQPDGCIFFYDKRHLFRMGNEHLTYSAGNSRLCVQWRGWRIGLLVCYDLRFPVWSRRSPDFDYECLIYVANWPTQRRMAWQQLLKARAIENLAYVAGVNRVGTDAKDSYHTGDSTLIDFTGKTVWECADKESLQVLHLSKNDLEQFRKDFPAWIDADIFSIK